MLRIAQISPQTQKVTGELQRPWPAFLPANSAACACVSSSIGFMVSRLRGHLLQHFFHAPRFFLGDQRFPQLLQVHRRAEIAGDGPNFVAGQNMRRSVPVLPVWPLAGPAGARGWRVRIRPPRSRDRRGGGHFPARSDNRRACPDGPCSRNRLAVWRDPVVAPGLPGLRCSCLMSFFDVGKRGAQFRRIAGTQEFVQQAVAAFQFLPEIFALFFERAISALRLLGFVW